MTISRTTLTMTRSCSRSSPRRAALPSSSTTSTLPRPPRSLRSTQVRFADIDEAPRREWFIAGTELNAVARSRGGDTPPHIRYPANGLILALDPDIPLDNERLTLDMAPLRTDHSWTLLRAGIPPCQIRLAATDTWAPEPGDWQLQLHGPDGQPLEQVHFTVRGSPRHPTACPADKG